MVQSVRTTIGRYVLGDRIDVGGPGEVYRAQSRREQVAIRLLPTTLTAEPDFASRFEREMGRIAELDHPGLIPILAYGQHDGVPYIVTAPFTGESLRDRFARNRPLPEELIVFLRQIAEGLDHAHARGITHGNLQPSSILITDDGAHLTNVGLAHLCESGGAEGVEASDPSADVAALARIAHHGLTGNLSQAALAGASAPGLGTIRRALANDYATAGEFVRDFADAQVAPPDAEATAMKERASLAAARQPTTHRTSRLILPQAFVPKTAAGQRVALLWVAGFALAIVLIGGGVFTLNSRGEKEPTNGSLPALAASIAPANGLPFDFPIDNALIVRRYEEAQGLLPAEAADGKLHRFAAECSDPRVPEDCLLVYVFYSPQSDQMYNYHFKVREDVIIGNFVERAENDDFRIVLNELPWVKNPNWANLVRESYAQLPANFAPKGFKVGLYGSAAPSNNGTADWTVVYIERDATTQHIFELLGDKVTKLPE